MLAKITQLVLLGALLAGLAAGGAPAFGTSTTCSCTNIKDRVLLTGKCRFDQRTGQCVNISCNGYCSQP